jgi:Fe-S-cluster containining protein
MKLIDREEDVGQFLRASRATTVYDPKLGKQVRVMKIGPARNRRGRCVFLDESDRCQIHGVSPFGCAYFDAHMPRAECDRRMLWGLVQIRSSPEYQSLRDTLPLAEDLSDHSKPAKGRKPGR